MGPYSIALIQFTPDGCDCVQALLFELRPIYGMNNESNWDLLQKDMSKHSCIQCPSPWCFPFLDHASSRDSWTLTSLAQSAVGTLILLLAPGEQKVLFVPSNCLFQTCGNSIIKSNWPIRSNSLRVLSPFARSPVWAIGSGPKTSLPVKEFL